MASVKSLFTVTRDDGPSVLDRRAEWGPFTWGRNEFEIWFGVNLKKTIWNRFRDEALLWEGFYGFTHNHP